MKLKKARVTNYRCVDDSEEFSIGQTTCLVGKNESGKTTVLRALEKLHPFEGSSEYDRTLDYPRRFLTDYEERHGDSEAEVVSTVWELEPVEIDCLTKEFGEGCLTSNQIQVSKLYGESKQRWIVKLNVATIMQNLAKSSGVTPPELANLKPHLANESAFIGYFNGIETEKPSALVTLHGKLMSFRNHEILLQAFDLLDDFMPKFFYVSAYDRMPGKVSVNDLVNKKAAKTINDQEKIFVDLLAFAGTSIEEFQNPQKSEELTAKVEAASIKISRQIFEYWSQNKNLKVQIKIESGRPADPSPFNGGDVIHARIYNTLHEMTVPFDDRSAGFTWFFSFLVKFSQVKKHHGRLIILLDEPGLNLHAKAQSDLLRYVREKLEPNHQVIYTTHSPFMIPADDLSSVRTVEDVVIKDLDGNVELRGTKVGDRVLSTDRDTLFPLQNALGYEITQSLFIGPNSLLVEGPSDLLYLQVFSNTLHKMKRVGLSERWTICPVGGVDKVASFVALFGGNRLNLTVFTDFASGQKKKMDDLRKSELIRDGSRVILATDLTGTAEADTEDLFGRRAFLQLVDASYGLAKGKSVEKALAAGKGIRVVKDVEDYFNSRPELGDPFSHFEPARWLVCNPMWLAENGTELKDAFDRFEKLFAKINGFLSTT